MIVWSGVVVLATYGVLIETWRRMIVAWGERLPFGDAVQMWFIAVLPRYLPWSPVFQLGAWTALARRQRISAVATAGAGVINTAVNIATGFVIALVAGYPALNSLSHGYARLGIVVAVLGLIALFMLPTLLPTMLRVFRGVTGRDLSIAALPRSAVYISLVGNTIAWLLYGVAYRALVIGIIGQANGSLAEFIGVYASAYVIGYLAVALPAGVVVREAAQINALSMLHIATAGQAAVIAIVARLWITVLEVFPALIFLALYARRPPENATVRHGSKS